jgi:hypothetical protein
LIEDLPPETQTRSKTRARSNINMKRRTKELPLSAIAIPSLVV